MMLVKTTTFTSRRSEGKVQAASKQNWSFSDEDIFKQIYKKKHTPVFPLRGNNMKHLFDTLDKNRAK